MGAAAIAIVIGVFVLLAAVGVAVWWFVFKPPTDLPGVCKDSVFYQNAPTFSKNAIAKACALQQPPLPEKDSDTSIIAPVGFASQWEANAVPTQAPAWTKTTYYAAKYVNKKDGSYGALSSWGTVQASGTQTLPSVSWNAGVYADASTWDINVYRAFKSDGSDSKLVGKGIYDPSNSSYGYVDYDHP